MEETKGFMKNILPLLIYCLFAGSAAAQQGVYQFSKTSEPFVPVLSGSLITNTFGQQAYSVTLPATLRLFDKPVGNVITAGKNGFVVATGTTHSFAIDPCITGLNKGNSSSISWFFETKDNDSVMVVQWLNMVPDSSNPGDYVSFQAKIYLKGQHIQYHYGPSQLTSAKYTEGRADITAVLFLLSKDFTTSYEAYTLYDDPATPSLSTDPNSTGTLDYFPAEGTVYNFRKKSGVGVKEIAQDIFSVYPNPAGSVINIQNAGHADAGRINIKNALGQEVYSTAIFTNTIDISGFPAGVYFLNIETGKGINTYKLVKE